MLEEFYKTDSAKMVLFMFLGLVIAILVLGFHRSPQVAPLANVGAQTQTRQANTNLQVSPTSVALFTESRMP